MTLLPYSAPAPAPADGSWELLHVKPEPAEQSISPLVTQASDEQRRQQQQPATPASGTDRAVAAEARGAAAGPAAEDQEQQQQQLEQSIEEQLASLRMAAERATSLVHDLGAKYCGEGEG